MHHATFDDARAGPDRANRLHVVTIEHKRLTNETLRQLEQVRIAPTNGETPSAALRRLLPHPFHDAVAIQKCNAVTIVAAVSTAADHSFVRESLLRCWLELAPGLAEHLATVDYLADLQAVEYLGEVSVGLRSVMLGDSQVHAQVVDGLNAARTAQDQSSPFTILVRNLRRLLQSVRGGTTLQEGNVSLERLGCELLSNHLGSGSGVVAVVGLGRTGRLMAEILANETSHNVVVTNRTARKAETLRDAGVKTLPYNDSAILDADALLICLDSTPETKVIIRQLWTQLRHDRPALVVDMSAPPITAGLPADGRTVMRIDRLSREAAARLSSRARSANKARQLVHEWAVVVDQRLRNRTSPSQVPMPVPADIGRLRAAVVSGIRARMAAEGFLEYPTPRGVPAAAFPPSAASGPLPAQPQLHLQLAVLAGLERTYEVSPRWNDHDDPGPMWSGEFLALDAELRDPAGLPVLYLLVLDMIKNAAGVVNRHTGSGTTVPEPGSIPVLTYPAALHTLREAGHTVPYGRGLDPYLELCLAEHIMAAHGTSVCVIVDHPRSSATLPLAYDPASGAAHRFTLLFNGWRIADGGLRDMSVQRIRNELLLSGRRADQYASYLDACAGAPIPTGGFRLDIDRLLARLLGRPTVHGTGTIGLTAPPELEAAYAR